MSQGWTTIESDPGVFTELIAGIGAKNVQVEDIYEISDEFLSQFKPVYGLVFLFKWRTSGGVDPTANVVPDAPNVFFAQQVINNACATQAILSILLNRPEVDCGEELTNFREFTKDFPPDLKGDAISNSDIIRTVHNSFARPEPFVMEQRRATEKDDVFHFISYVPINGVLYELDGLQKGPISHGPVTDDTWLSRAREVIQGRISQYTTGELRFNLLAVVADRRAALTEEAHRVAQSYIAIADRIRQLGAEPAPMPAIPPMKSTGGMDVDSLSPELEEARAIAISETLAVEDVEVLKQQLREITNRLQELSGRIRNEEEKHHAWKEENIRRKHNYIPFIVQLLRILAEKGELMPLLENAKADSR